MENHETEEWINDLEGGIVEITAAEQNIGEKNEKKRGQAKRPLGQR